MPYTKIIIHAVWGTKNRAHFLTDYIRTAVIAHIREYAKEKGIYIDRLNGFTDHLHCLFALNANISIAKVMNLLKGESSYWINKQLLTSSKFEWADEYYAASVSESALNRVRAYIDNQEQYHKMKTFQQEYHTLINSALKGGVNEEGGVKKRARS